MTRTAHGLPVTLTVSAWAAFRAGSRLTPRWPSPSQIAARSGAARSPTPAGGAPPPPRPPPRGPPPLASPAGEGQRVEPAEPGREGADRLARLVAEHGHRLRGLRIAVPALEQRLHVGATAHAH